MRCVRAGSAALDSGRGTWADLAIELFVLASPDRHQSFIGDLVLAARHHGSDAPASGSRILNRLVSSDQAHAVAAVGCPVLMVNDMAVGIASTSGRCNSPRLGWAPGSPSD